MNHVLMIATLAPKFDFIQEHHLDAMTNRRSNKHRTKSNPQDILPPKAHSLKVNSLQSSIKSALHSINLSSSFPTSLFILSPQKTEKNLEFFYF